MRGHPPRPLPYAATQRRPTGAPPRQLAIAPSASPTANVLASRRPSQSRMVRCGPTASSRRPGLDLPHILSGPHIQERQRGHGPRSATGHERTLERRDRQVTSRSCPLQEETNCKKCTWWCCVGLAGVPLEGRRILVPSVGRPWSAQ
ncbi:uncharacterized protein [Triticum aestivum]|uniref:uncharacterized protein n=1 Tax=Triticum aestivum TaxID=4565 RepID=UPI001D01E448|nr:uncharacterized protein LOC123137355 [Triticum aestivum]